MDRFLLTFLLFFYHLDVHSQIIEVDSIISQNKITDYKGQQLILVDFWATWCGPCVHATRQLEIIQDLYPDEIFMISISDENNGIIANYLKEKPIKIMVVSDYETRLFSKFNITNRPYAVLFSQEGRILWQGKPGDLTYLSIKKYFKSKSNEFYEIDKIVKTKEKSNPQNIIIENKDTFEEFFAKFTTGNKPLKTNPSYYGTLRKFIAESKSIPIQLVDSNLITNQIITVKYSGKFKQNNSLDILLDSVLYNLGYKLTSVVIPMNIRELIVSNESLLWDKGQIEWKKGSSKFLIGENRIEADNATLGEIATELSKQRSELIVYLGKNMELYDWSFNYTVDQLMNEEFENSFGCTIKPAKKAFKVYRVEKL